MLPATSTQNSCWGSSADAADVLGALGETGHSLPQFLHSHFALDTFASAAATQASGGPDCEGLRLPCSGARGSGCSGFGLSGQAKYASGLGRLHFHSQGRLGPRALALTNDELLKVAFSKRLQIAVYISSQRLDDASL